jgi:periplasmic protein TonB
MTELALPASNHGTHPQSGYAAGRKRSPGALAAALALNGGAFAIILLMPATQYIIDKVETFTARNITIEPDPTEVDPVKQQERNETQTPRPTTKEEDTSFVITPINPLDGTGPAIGGKIPDLGQIGDTGTMDPPYVPPHTAVFVKAMQDPRYAKAFHPDYPPSLVREGLEGSVTVRVTIDETGRVTAVELVKATDRAFFEETREQALRYWRFKPATSDGAPIASQQVLTVQFDLKDQ